MAEEVSYGKVCSVVVCICVYVSGMLSVFSELGWSSAGALRVRPRAIA